MVQHPDCERDKVDDLYVDKAIAFIEDHGKHHGDKPFFVYLPLNAIHSAARCPKRYQGKSSFSEREDKIHWVNESVAEMLSTIDRLKLADDTLVLFTSDNGPNCVREAIEAGHLSAGPYRGFKTCSWDGGTRVPLVARWPGHIPEAVTTDNLIGLTDVLATIAAICGEPLPAGAGPDSVNQLPLLLQQKEQISLRPSFVTTSNSGLYSLRQGKWKVIFGTKWSGGIKAKGYGFEKIPDGTPKDDPNDPELGQLYDLSVDPYETNDLWGNRPEVVATLRQELSRIQQLEPSDEIRW